MRTLLPKITKYRFNTFAGLLNQHKYINRINKQVNSEYFYNITLFKELYTKIKYYIVVRLKRGIDRQKFKMKWFSKLSKTTSDINVVRGTGWERLPFYSDFKEAKKET